MNITIENLKQFSDNGDQEATEILLIIESYQEKKIHTVNAEIGAKIGDITTILSRPDAITSRDVEVPLTVARLANEWAQLIQPIDENTEFIG